MSSVIYFSSGHMSVGICVLYVYLYMRMYTQTWKHVHTYNMWRTPIRYDTIRYTHSPPLPFCWNKVATTAANFVPLWFPPTANRPKIPTETPRHKGQRKQKTISKWAPLSILTTRRTVQSVARPLRTRVAQNAVP